jgi:hypothetical protein
MAQWLTCPFTPYLEEDAKGIKPVPLQNNPAIELCDFNEFLHLSA